MKSPTGQTLIESLLAIAIIVIGVISLLGLLVATRSQAGATQYEAVAMQLGGEAVEAVRFIRDSNWLEMEDGIAGVEFDTGLRSGTNYNGVYRWNRSGADPNTAITIQFLGNSTITATQAIVYQDASGYYRQTSGSPSGAWAASPFRRWVTTYPICYNVASSTEYILSADGQHCTDADPANYSIGIQVVAQVQWQSKGETHDRWFEERLYNWKYAEIP